MNFEGRDILSTEDLSKEEILEIMKVTAEMEDLYRTQHVSDLLADKLVAAIFLEPSTRTRLSFEAAIKRLGAKAITVADAKSSSAAGLGSETPPSFASSQASANTSWTNTATQ